MDVASLRGQKQKAVNLHDELPHATASPLNCCCIAVFRVSDAFERFASLAR